MLQEMLQKYCWDVYKEVASATAKISGIFGWELLQPLKLRRLKISEGFTRSRNERHEADAVEKRWHTLPIFSVATAKATEFLVGKYFAVTRDQWTGILQEM